MQCKELKKRQHYVQKEYLVGWTNNNSIFQLFKPSKIKEMSLDNAQVGHFFYRFFSINNEEKLFLLSFLPKEITANFFSNKRCDSIEDVISIMADLPHALHHSSNYFFYSIDLLLWVASVLELMESWPEEITNRDDYKSIVKFIETQPIEELLCGIEEMGIPVMKRLIDPNVDISSITKEDIEQLTMYVAMAYTRTKDTADTICETKNKNIRIERIRSLLQFTLGICLGQILIQRNSDILVLKNVSTSRFITGSQPVVNMSFEKGKSVDKFVPYFPLNPHTAILINPDGTGTISEEILENELSVSLYNSKIFEFSNVLIAVNEDDLLQFVERNLQ